MRVHCNDQCAAFARGLLSSLAHLTSAHYLAKLRLAGARIVNSKSLRNPKLWKGLYQRLASPHSLEINVTACKNNRKNVCPPKLLLRGYVEKLSGNMGYYEVSDTAKFCCWLYVLHLQEEKEAPPPTPSPCPCLCPRPNLFHRFLSVNIFALSHCSWPCDIYHRIVFLHIWTHFNDFWALRFFFFRWALSFFRMMLTSVHRHYNLFICF